MLRVSCVLVYSGKRAGKLVHYNKYGQLDYSRGKVTRQQVGRGSQDPDGIEE